jgi:hypothetical protein
VKRSLCGSPSRQQDDSSGSRVTARPPVSAGYHQPQLSGRGKLQAWAAAARTVTVSAAVSVKNNREMRVCMGVLSVWGLRARRGGPPRRYRDRCGIPCKSGWHGDLAGSSQASGFFGKRLIF